MKKVSYVLLIAGVILIGIAIIFLTKTSKKTLNESAWQVISSEKTSGVITAMDINCNCNSYDYEDFISEYLYATDGSENTYYYVVPNNEKLVKTEDSYEFDGTINITFGSTSFSNIDSYILDNYSEKTSSKVYIQKNAVDANKIAVLAKIIANDGSNYYEELTIYFHNNENSYTYVKYSIDNSKFSSKTIEKLVTDAYKDQNKAKYTTCKKENNEYACAIEAPNKEVSFKVNSNKYFLQVTERLNNYSEIFVNADENINDSIEVAISLSSEMNWLSEYDKKELSIGGKDIIKYTKDSNNAYYVIKLDANVIMVVNVYSEKNNLDSIAKDFVNYTISG